MFNAYSSVTPRSGRRAASVVFIAALLAVIAATDLSAELRPPQSYDVPLPLGKITFSYIHLRWANGELLVQANAKNDSGILWSSIKLGVHAYFTDGSRLSADLDARESWFGPLETKNVTAWLKPAPHGPDDLADIKFSIREGTKRTIRKGPTYSGFVITSEDCLKDFAAAIGEAPGLARRKKLTELVSYGCALVIEKPYGFSAIKQQSVPFEKKQIVLMKGTLVNVDEKPSIVTGWVQSELIQEGIFPDIETYPPKFK